MYYIYILRCSDNSLYTGITTDFKKRYETHFNKTKEAAKYTKSRQIAGVEALWISDTKSEALKLELRIKKLKKVQKEHLIAFPESFDEYFPELDGKYFLTDVKKALL